MKKLFIVAFSFFFVVSSLEAQERKTSTIRFQYENGKRWSDSVGDTLTGVAAGAASIDTITFSGLVNGKLASSFIIAVNKDTSFLNATNGKIDTTLLHILRGVGGMYTSVRDTLRQRGGLYIASDILGFVVNDFITEYIIDEGSNAGTDFRLLIDHTLMANTDSTSYKVRIVAVYDE